MTKLFRPYYFKVLVVSFCILLECLFYSSISIFFSYISEVLSNKDGNKLIVALTTLFTALFVVMIVTIARYKLYGKISSEIIHDIRDKLFDKLSKLPISYYSQNTAPQILSNFSLNLRSVEIAINSFSSGIILPSFMFLVNLIILGHYNWILSILAIPAVFLMYIVPSKVGSKLEDKDKSHIHLESQLLSKTEEVITLQTVIRVLNLNDFIKSKFSELNSNLTGNVYIINFLNGLIVACADLIPVLLLLLFLATNSYIAYKGTIPISLLITFQLMFGNIIYSIVRLTYNIPNIFAGMLALKGIRRFLTEPDYSPDKTNLNEIMTFNKEITFDQIYFGYNSLETNLSNINLKIPRGSSIAFVGSSGSGKSTILNLIMGLYRPRQGSITFDSFDIQNLSRESFYHLIGCVFQEPLLFNVSIYENIRFGNLNATKEMIEKAAKAAEIHDTIMSFTQGYNTIAGERGKNLSSGQKQGVVIARALVRSPQILLFDEITSALDTPSERAINNIVTNLQKDHTTISVTHRLSSIVNVDCIYLLHQGQIAEYGTHRELINKNGLYKELWDKQNGFIFFENNNDIEVTKEKLLSIPLFKDLPDGLIMKCINLFTARVYTDNQIIINEGEMTNQLFIIVRGKVEVSHKDYGKDKVIAILEDGDFFGEIALLKTTPRTATVKVLTHCLLLSIKKEDFEKVLADNLDLTKKLERSMEERIDKNAIKNKNS